MNKVNQKENFLALCLLEAIEDENLIFMKTLLERGASSNTIIRDKEFAPIHFCAGMENVEFSEEAMKVLLSYDGDANIQTDEGLTPFHVACIWGRDKIVKLLLRAGGIINIKDVEDKTPLQYAITECHFDVIKEIQNYIFELKINKKVSESHQRTLDSVVLDSPSKVKNNSLLSVKNLEESKYTPNRINYNFDVTSPYYVNITHRRKDKKNQLNLEIQKENIEPSSTSENDTNNDVNFSSDYETKNLFELTENNLMEFSRDCTVFHNFTTIVNIWREKISLPTRTSIFKAYTSIDELLSEFESETITPSTRGDNGTKSTENNNLIIETDNSFHTAQHSVEGIRENSFIKSPNHDLSFMTQITENYVHTDKETGMVFYETKILPNPVSSKQQTDPNSSHSTVSTEFTIPLEYDTDALRAELTIFGEPPGPITKSTKRLYLKRLVKYKRNPESVAQLCLNTNKITDQNFSIEVRKTLRDLTWIDSIAENLELEKQMIEYFQQNPTKKFREGHLKTSFIYMLIDPRISDNLPGQYKLIDRQQVWKTFLTSIFYVGKGKSSRPYSHLYDAMKYYTKYCDTKLSNGVIDNQRITLPNKYNGVHELLHESNLAYSSSQETIKDTTSNHTQKKLFNANQNCNLPKKSTNQDNKKLERIIDIWKSQKGVVCLHLFHNIMPAEAYTREASIIDCLTLNHLTNLKRGDYYGATQSWSLKMRKNLGIGLMYRAMQIYLNEGESQLKPHDLV